MYVPNYFKNENLSEVKSFLDKNSFGILMSQVNQKITGSHIPMQLDTSENGKDILVGHLAKANPQASALKNTDEVLAIFNGPHGYVSSSWYEKENVPTWNYIAVHVYGTVKIIEGKELLESLRRLVNKYEKKSKNPVSVDKMSNATLGQINGIIGFTITINEIQAAYKLSQNRNEHDHHKIKDELEKTGDVHAIDLAKEMKIVKG